MPRASDVIREAVIVVAGAFLAAWIMRQWPAGKQWIKDSWQ